MNAGSFNSCFSTVFQAAHKNNGKHYFMKYCNYLFVKCYFIFFTHDI